MEKNWHNDAARALADKIEYRYITQSDISDDMFSDFNRYQKVTRQRHKVDSAWTVVDVDFVDDWDDANKARKVNDVKKALSSGGMCAGAFLEGKLKGLAIILPEKFGSRGQYIELSSMHTSCDMRGAGVGRRVFEMACDAARKLGGERMYMSAHSAVESQAFYAAMGCVEAEEPDPAHVEDEPWDVQMEIKL